METILPLAGATKTEYYNVANKLLVRKEDSLGSDNSSNWNQNSGLSFKIFRDVFTSEELLRLNQATRVIVRLKSLSVTWGDNDCAVWSLPDAIAFFGRKLRFFCLADCKTVTVNFSISIYRKSLIPLCFRM